MYLSLNFLPNVFYVKIHFSVQYNEILISITGGAELLEDLKKKWNLNSNEELFELSDLVLSSSKYKLSEQEKLAFNTMMADHFKGKV